MKIEHHTNNQLRRLPRRHNLSQMGENIDLPRPESFGETHLSHDREERDQCVLHPAAI